MTREEAIDLLDNLKGMIEDSQGNDYDKAFGMAIEALKQEPCDDAVSRTDIDEMKEIMTDIEGDYVYAVRTADIRKLPSVTPTRPKGKWIEIVTEIDSLGNRTWYHKCSNCGNEDSGWGKYKYCPNCGADMRANEV